MKPQLCSPLGRIIVLIFGLFALAASPFRAEAATCTLPTGPTTYVASSTGPTTAGNVFVIDAALNTVACSITVGKAPVNLAVSPDSSLLFVENDTDGTVSVINLTTGAIVTTLTLPGVTAPMTANLAVSPDNSRVYVVSLPATLTATTQASLNVISLPGLTVSPAVSVVAPAPAAPTPVTAPGLGIAFTPDSTGAFIATESLTYKVTTSNDSVSSTVSANGGTTAIDQNGNFAYVVDVTASGSTPMSQITISNNAVSTLTGITPVCNQGNTAVIPPPPKGNLAYYSCPGNASFSLSSFIQAIDFTSATPNAAVQHVTVSNTGAHPRGIAVTSDGNAAYVALDDGTVAIVNTSVSPNTLSATAISAGGSPGGIVHRPVKLPSLTPTAPSVSSGATQQFNSSVLYAFSTGGSTPIWAVNGVVGGNSTLGTISTSGLYKAPNTIPSPATVTVSVTSSEVPFVSKLYPLTATVTITPSQLVFTSAPVTVTAGACSGGSGIIVQSRDASNTPANPSSLETLTLASSSTGTTTFYSDSACTTTITSASIPTSTNSATFYYKDTKAGSPTITVTGSGSFIATAMQSETVNAGAAATLTVAGYPSSFTPGTSNSFTVTAKDASGNTATGYAGTVHFTSSDPQAVLPANYTFVAADSGMHTFNATLKTTGTQSITATDTVTASITGTQSGITSGTITASTLIVAGFASTVTAGSSNSFTVTAQDGLGNTATGYAGTVHFTSSDPQAVLPANYTFVAADSGMHTFNATLKTAATQSITATDTATVSITGTQSGITVNPGPTSTLIVTGFASPVVAGTPSNITVTAKDGFGNTTPAYAGTVHFTSTDAQAVLPANYTFVAADSGAHMFSATLKTAGTQSITATDTVTNSITGAQSGITVSPGPASTLIVTGFASPATAGTASTFTVTAKDASGNTATGYAGTVHFTSSDAQALLPTNYTFVVADSGAHMFSGTLKTAAATQTITATDTVTTSITGTQAGITVNPGPASTLIVAGFASTVTAGIASNFTVTAKDASGNTATGYGGTVHFTSTDAQAVLPANYTFVAADSGVHMFSATLKTATSQSITATDTVTNSITGTQAGITVNPAAPSQLVFKTAAQTLTAGVCSAGITVQTQDQFNNASNVSVNTPVNLSSNSSGTAVFSGAGTCTPTTTSVTIAAGQNAASFFYSDTKAAGPTITAAANGLTSATQGETVNPGPPAALVYTTQPLGTSINTALAAVKVTIQDSFQNVVTSSTAPITMTSSSTSTGAGTVSGMTTVPALNGVAIFNNLQFTIAGTYTLIASTGQLSVNSSSFIITSNVAVSVMILPSTTFLPAPASSSNPPTVAVGFSVCLMATITGDANNLGVRTWNPTAGTILTTASQACNGVVPPAGSFTATYTAPAAAVPSPLTVNVTASAVADPGKTSAPIMLNVVSDQLVYDAANPTGMLTVPPAPVTSGKITIDLQGQANIPISDFSCPDLGPLNGKGTCTFTATGSSVECPATQCTSVTLTLSVPRGSPAGMISPISISPSARGGSYNLVRLTLLLPFVVAGFALLRLWMSGRRLRVAFVFAMLLSLALGWSSACNQFTTPATPPNPIHPVGSGIQGTLTVQASGGSFATVRVPVPFLVQ
jgi:hypothetical protein